MLRNKITLTLTMEKVAKNHMIHAVHTSHKKKQHLSKRRMYVLCRAGWNYEGPDLTTYFGKPVIVTGEIAGTCPQNFSQYLDISSIEEPDDPGTMLNHLILGVECIRKQNENQYFCNHYRKSKPPISIIAKTGETLEDGQFYILAGAWMVWKNYLTGKEKTEIVVETVSPHQKKDGPGVRELLQMGGNGSNTIYESIDDVLEDQYMLYTEEKKNYFRDCLVVARVLLREVCG